MEEKHPTSVELRAEIADLRKRLAAAEKRDSDAPEPEPSADDNEEFCRKVEAELESFREKLLTQREAEPANPAEVERLEHHIAHLETARARIASFIDWKESFRFTSFVQEEEPNRDPAAAESEDAGISESEGAAVGEPGDDNQSEATVDFVPIGHVAVESAQLLIADPWIVHAFWKHEPMEDVRRFKDVFTGLVYQYRVDFHDFHDVVPALGMSVTEAMECSRLVQLAETQPPFYTLSYNQISKANAAATDEATPGAELAFDDGVPGAGVSVPLVADGTYPVFAETRDGAVVRIYIDI